MPLIGVPKLHRIVALRAQYDGSCARGWLLAKKFFPERALLARLFARGALLNEFTQAPTTKQVSDMLCQITCTYVALEVRELGAIERIAAIGVRLCRHYHHVQSPDFWELPQVLPHRMAFSSTVSADTVTLMGEHSSYHLGSVGRELARVLAEDIQTRQAA